MKDCGRYIKRGEARVIVMDSRTEQSCGAVYVLQIFLQWNYTHSSPICFLFRNIPTERKENTWGKNIKQYTCFTAGCGSFPPWRWDVLSCWQETWESWVCVTSRWAGHLDLWASESWWFQPSGQPWHRWSCLQLGWRGSPPTPIWENKTSCQISSPQCTQILELSVFKIQSKNTQHSSTQPIIQSVMTRH